MVAVSASGRDNSSGEAEAVSRAIGRPPMRSGQRAWNIAAWNAMLPER